MSAIILSPVGAFALPVTVSEQHISALEITKNPIETGGTIADHAYRVPREVTLEVAQAFPQASWQVLKRIQMDRRPFTLVSGLDVYRSMLIKDISATRDPSSALILSASILLQETILVQTASFVVEGGAENAGSPVGGSTDPATGGASRPTAATSAPDRATQARTGGTVHRGDTPTVAAPTTGGTAEAAKNESILSSILR